MTMKQHLFITVFIILTHSCTAVIASTERPTIYTSNFPLYSMTLQIVGDQADVVFPAPEDVDPAFWVPDKDQVYRYQDADLIVFNGAGYEKWASKVSLPRLRIINTTRMFREELLTTQVDAKHSHGPTGEHSHVGTAFTTWLDLSMAAGQAEAICHGVSRRYPASADTFGNNFKQLESELLALDKDLLALGGSLADTPLLGSHPVYQYLNRRYGLQMTMVMWEPDEFPGESELRKVSDLVAEQRIQWMIWEDEPLPEIARRLTSMGVSVIVYRPCFNRPESGDFVGCMRENIQRLGRIAN